jgi:hypothetical protein
VAAVAAVAAVVQAPGFAMQIRAAAVAAAVAAAAAVRAVPVAMVVAPPSAFILRISVQAPSATTTSGTITTIMAYHRQMQPVAPEVLVVLVARAVTVAAAVVAAAAAMMVAPAVAVARAVPVARVDPAVVAMVARLSAW